VPHTVLADLVPEEAKRKDSAFRNLAMLKTAPITGVHLWFDREVMTEPFLTLLDTTTQWIFNKTALYAPSTGAAKKSEKGQYLQLVVSASYNLLQKPRQEIIDLCLKEVRQALPAARDANLIKATVIKEAAATFSPEPGVDRWRPKQEICFSRAIGPTPVGPPPWKALFAADIWRLKPFSAGKAGRINSLDRIWAPTV